MFYDVVKFHCVLSIMLLQICRMEENDENFRKEMEEVRKKTTAIATPPHDLNVLNQELDGLKEENASSQEKMDILEQKLSVKYISLFFHNLLFVKIGVSYI